MGAQAGDRRKGVLGVPEFSAREEVLAPPELHFVEVYGIRIRANHELHGLHGLFRATEFVIRSRHLVEDLVAILILWVLLEQLFIERDRLKRTFGSCVSAWHFCRHSASIAARRDPALRSCAPLKFLIGFTAPRAGSCSGRIGLLIWFALRRLGGLWGRHWLRLALACAYAVLLLQFQIRETADCLGRHRGFR